MTRRKTSIPVNAMADDSGIAIERISFKELQTDDRATLNSLEEGETSHRHDRHSFFLLEEGSVSIEIDFQKYEIKSPSVLYLHPDQVHRIVAFKNVTVSTLAINDEKLNAEYLTLLEGITPAKPLELDKETFSFISEAVSLCLKFSERKSDKLYHAILKNSCNTLIALIVSLYLEHTGSADKLSRFEVVTKAFKETVERNYTTLKRPTAYAQKLHLSTTYLNECVKNTTGYSVSYYIQQRVILEAKRLLCHSDASVKEIATELGFDDYPYFSRLFTKVTGMTALAFRNKNLD